LGRKQYIVIGIALITAAVLYYFGNTSYPKKALEAQQTQLQSVSTTTLLQEVDGSLTPKQKEHLQHLQQDLSNATSDTAKISAYFDLAGFFENDTENEELAAYYYAEKVKLENSQKNLTFAANLLLRNCINDNPTAKRNFRAGIAKELFEKALQNEPESDSLKIGLGGCYMHGAGGANPMEGIQKVLGALQKDSTNAYAHKMLGFGNLQNGQYEKAVDRFIKSYQYNNNDKMLLWDIAVGSKRNGNMELSDTYYKKAKEAFAVNPQLLADFEKEYKATKSQSSK
jgi:tetratricopeptide (TPR) repeat protein